jgi:ribose/xylose/arabinose/galactoside ABC-type transport system permease subunit
MRQGADVEAVSFVRFLIAGLFAGLAEMVSVTVLRCS